MVTESNRGISFVIEKRLGVLSTSSNGWRKELNLVSWNGRQAKLDLREWSPDHEKMAKGITLRSEEAQILQKALYRWLTGYGKPQSRSEAAASVPETAEASEASLEGQADEPVLEYDVAEEELLCYEPETGEILEFDEEKTDC